MTTPKAKFAGLSLIAALRAVLVVCLLVAVAAPTHAEGRTVGVYLIIGECAYKKGDFVEAVPQFRIAAEEDDRLSSWDRAAEFLNGLMYERGQNVPQDYTKAVKWYRKAAEGGQPMAQYRLGFMYRMGHGVTQDYVQAHAWYNLAASRLPPGQRDLAVKNRDIVAKRMTPAQISEAKKLAREWKPQ